MDAVVRRILKWRFPADETDLLVPWSYRDEVLLVAGEAGRLTPSVWALQDCDPEDGTTTADYGHRAFVLVGTGQPPPGGWPHAGSAICSNGQETGVWHVYAQPVEVPPGVRRRPVV